MGTHHSRGVRRGAEPYAFRGTHRVAAGPAQNRRFLPPDGRPAPGLVAASHHRPPSLRCHARRRSPSSAARAAGMPPYPAVPDELDQRAPNHDGGRDDSRRCARPRCARSVILGDSALRLRHCTLTDLEITARQRRARCTSTATGHPLLDARSESAWESIMRVLHHGRPGIRVGWLRGRACSTTRSWDGLAALAPTATGRAIA